MTNEEIIDAFELMDIGEVMLFNNLGESFLAPLSQGTTNYGGSVQTLSLVVNGLNEEQKKELCELSEQLSDKKYGGRPCYPR